MSPPTYEALSVFALGLDGHPTARRASSLKFLVQLERKLSGSKGSLIDTIHRRFEHQRHRHVFGGIRDIGKAIIETRCSTVRKQTFASESPENICSIDCGELAECSNTQSPQDASELWLVENGDGQGCQEFRTRACIDDARSSRT